MGSKFLEAPQGKERLYSDDFHSVWPSYLAMGMSREDFWNGPAELVKDYRAAENIRLTKANQQMWLQGLYMAHAIAACLDKKSEYPKEPLFIYAHEQEAKRKRDRQRAIAFFNQFAALHKAKGGG